MTALLALGLDGFAAWLALGALRVFVRNPVLLVCLLGACDGMALLVGVGNWVTLPALVVVWAGLIAPLMLRYRGVVWALRRGDGAPNENAY